MKILAVGMNYPEHNKEQKNSLLLQEPVIFSKPESALLREGKPFFIPDFANQFEYETEIVVRINRLGKSISQRYAHRYYNEITVGIDFTARDLQRDLRSKGLPWDLCKGFDGSAAVGKWIPVSKLTSTVDNLHFHLDIDGKTVQQGWTGDMMHSIDKIISFVSTYFTLKTGDIIFTGPPAGVGPISENQHLEAYLEDIKVLEFNIK